MLIKNARFFAHQFKRFIENMMVNLLMRNPRLRYEMLDHYEYETLVKILKTLNVDLVLDVGANTGQFAKAIIDMGYKGKIVSFEPLSEAYSKLSDISKPYPQWTVFEKCALGDEEGEVTINISKNLVSSSILPMHPNHLQGWPGSDYVAKETIKIRKLSSLKNQLFTKCKTPFLKADVQGFEKQVLDGAADVLSSFCGLYLELSLDVVYDGQWLMTDMIRYLEKSFFKLWNIFPVFSSINPERLLSVTAVFIREESAANYIRNNKL